jgi:hypothetical protein
VKEKSGLFFIIILVLFIITACNSKKQIEIIEEEGKSSMQLQIGENILTAVLEKNSSTEALIKMLEEGPITINMNDYGNMEKVGLLGTNLPRNDQKIKAEPGDLILYQGNALVIYYESNSWNFTRLGKIKGFTKEELKQILGDGDISVILSLN